MLPLGGSRVAPTGDGLLDANGGAIRADRVCAELSRSLGVSVKAGRVLGLQVGEAGVEVQTSVGVWSCDHAIVAAGAHTATLASAQGVAIAERRGMHAQITFEVKTDCEPPCFLDRSGEFGELAYGSVVPERQEMAVGLDNHDELLDVLEGDVLSPSAKLSEIEERIAVYAKEALPEVLGPPKSARLCVFTPLGDEPDAFSAWQAGPITFVAGHNAFKFAPLIGAELADVAEGRALPEPLRPDPARAPDDMHGC